TLSRIRSGGYGDDPADWLASTTTGGTPGPVNFNTATITGRYVFYNASAFDGNNPFANSTDDAAIDTTKLALLPGQTATAANTGLLPPDVFHFGNLVGDTGNDSSIAPGALVSAADLAATRVSGGATASVTTAADFNKDGVVNTADATIARSNSMHALQFLLAPATPALATEAAAAASSATVASSSAATTVQASTPTTVAATVLPAIVQSPASTTTTFTSPAPTTAP